MTDISVRYQTKAWVTSDFRTFENSPCQIQIRRSISPGLFSLIVNHGELLCRRNNGLFRIDAEEHVICINVVGEGDRSSVAGDIGRI